ncbi:hepatitis A virus cellular receptor 2 homolog isoform X2 [Labrus bergylta]|uniref:hepatitis A virus cellular receptor 2 homolog isoform X2 n=1 Tax=Labrus bergylta TaxID=56723 RepID=UPI0033144296
MNELKWIQTSLLLTALLQFAAAGDKEVTVKASPGENAMLSCETVIQGQQKCEYTTWGFVDDDLRNKEVVDLVVKGQVKNSTVKSDRLRVTEDCSLVIKKITEEDAGSYLCQQIKSGRITGDKTRVHLSVNKSEDTKPEPTRPPTTTRPPPAPATTKPPATTTKTTTLAGDWLWWWILVAVVVFIVLLVVVVKVIRQKGNRTQMGDDVADPEGGVSYASIRYNKKGKRGARVSCLIG